MGKHNQGKHRLVQPYAVRNRIGTATAIIAFGLIAPVFTQPTATAAVVNQAYVTEHHDGDHHDGGGFGDRHRPVYLRGCPPFTHFSIHLERCVPDFGLRHHR